MRQLAVLVLALSATAAIAAGCGGGGGERLSKEAYQQEVRDIGQTIEKRFGDFANLNVDPSNLKGLADTVDTLAKALDTAAGELRKLRPPEEVQAVQDKLVDGLRELADLARGVADKVRNAPLSELSESLDELDISKSDAFRRIQEAIQEFQDKGYELGRLGS